MKDIAIGSYEAACLMGVQFGRPKRMYDSGLIEGRSIDPAWVKESSRKYVIYSAASAEQNFKDHQAGRFGKQKNPRAYMHLRPVVEKRLAEEKKTVLYDDAIGTAEAAKILGVHASMVQKLIGQGKIIARRAWNARNGKEGIVYIISRKSCEANRRENAAREAAGKKRGPSRKK